VKFSDDQMALEFKDGLEEDVRHIVEALDQWSRENKFPEVVVTQVLRSVDEQEDIYSRYGLGLLAKLKSGESMGPKERALAFELAKLSLPELRKWARGKFTWHMVGCAVDLRSRHYRASQLVEVIEFLQKRLAPYPHELLAHDITAPHVHLAIKKAEKRADVQ
jgi:predicted alpha/beta hydrolase